MKKRRRTYLSEDDSLALSELMQKGFSFRDSLHLIETDRNRECVRMIEQEASAGRKLNEVLVHKIHPSLTNYMQGFSVCMTLSESILAAVEVHKSTQALKNKLQKELLYPLLLLSGVLAGILLFNKTILPSLINMMHGFSENTTDLQKLQTVIHVGVMTLLISVLALSVITLYLLSPERIAGTLKKVSRISSSSLLNQYASILFTRYFLACSKRHVPTRMALTAIASLKDNPLPSFVASELDRQLIHGETMAEAVNSVYLEEKLVRFFKIAIHAGECTEMLQGYLDMAERRAERQVRMFSKTIQLISYSCIGLILILVYRILMMPMQMLKNI